MERRIVLIAMRQKKWQSRLSVGIEATLSGGQLFDLPIGKIYAKNITPDKTGIGDMTDAEFARALRYGVTT